MTGVSDQRWQNAEEVELDSWSAGGFELEAFRDVVEPSMKTAGWARPHLKFPAGESLELGAGPLEVGCTRFL
jgi:hypothetical protein